MNEILAVIISVASIAIATANMWGIGKLLDGMEELKNDIDILRKQ
jgi:hypothetical protein